MKKFIVYILLFFPAFCLYAQSSASVYVPQITGTGSKPGDNAYFYDQIISEITYQRFNMAKAQKDAEFSLVGTLSTRTEPSGKKEYVLHLALIDNKTNTSRSEGELIYEVPEDIKELFPTLVYTLLFTIPQDSGTENWRNKWLFVSGAAYWTPRIYTAESASTIIANFGGGLFAELHFLNFMSFGAGVEVAPDQIKVSADQNYSNILMQIPVYVKYVAKLGAYFLLEPYAGVHFNIPFTKTTKPPVVSWLIGIQWGVKAGPGVIFIDPRFSMDIGKSVLDEETSGIKDLSFQRYIIHVGIGYKIGLFTKR